MPPPAACRPLPPVQWMATTATATSPRVTPAVERTINAPSWTGRRTFMSDSQEGRRRKFCCPGILWKLGVGGRVANETRVLLLKNSRSLCEAARASQLIGDPSSPILQVLGHRVSNALSLLCVRVLRHVHVRAHSGRDDATSRQESESGRERVQCHHLQDDLQP